MSYKYHGKRPPFSEIDWIIQGQLQGQKVNFRVKWFSWDFEWKNPFIALFL